MSTFNEPNYPTREDVPKIALGFPRPIQALHQIEMTSRCNLRCVYCVSPDLQREKVDMSEEHFRAALKHVKHYVSNGTQTQLNIAGTGESTLHPRFVELVQLARDELPNIPFLFATNGVVFTEEIARGLADIGLTFCWVSLHRPEKAGLAVQIAKKYGLLMGTSTDPATNANTWAGQVDWFESATTVMPCRWLRYGIAMALADGRVSACCLDSSGAGAIGHVDDPVGSLRTRPYKLCKTCHHEVGVLNFNQQGS